MNNPIPRRQVLAAIGALLLVSTSISVPTKASENSPLYAAFTGAWQVSRDHRPPGGRRGPRSGAARGDRDFGPGGPGRRGDPTAAGDTSNDKIPGLDRGDRHVRMLMTAAGRKAFDSMNPLDLPANNCKSPGLPSIVMTPNLQVWSLSGDTLTIHHEYYDTVRTIHLDRRTHPADAKHTAAGDAVSWMDGDTLVIETADLAPTLGGLSRNAPSSDARTVTERYRLSPDHNTLYGEMTLRDPKYLTRPLVVHVTMTRQPRGTKIETFPCSIDHARDYLKQK